MKRRRRIRLKRDRSGSKKRRVRAKAAVVPEIVESEVVETSLPVAEENSKNKKSKGVFARRKSDDLEKDDAFDDILDSGRSLRIVLRRQWDMIRTLARSQEGMTVEELAIACNMSEKTVKRDIKSLEYAFGDLGKKNEAHGRKRYYFDKDPFSFALTLTRDELLSVYIGQKLASPLKGTPFWDGLQSSCEKIRNVLHDETVLYADRVAPVFYRFEPSETHYTEEQRAIIEQALESMTNNCALRVKYRSIKARRVKEYDIYPFNFIYWDSFIYLMGYCCRDGKIKIWKFNRIYEAQCNPRRKFNRKDFDVERALEYSIAPFIRRGPAQTVKIRFTGYAARDMKERNLSVIRSITEETTSDGKDSIIVEMEASVNGAFLSLIMKYGRHAEILEPKEVRRQFLDELNRTRELYLDAIGMEERQETPLEDKGKRQKLTRSVTEAEQIVPVRRKRGRPRRVDRDV